SSMLGRFSITHGVRLSMEAEITATAVFFPPLTRTVPSRRCPPVMSILSSAMRDLLVAALYLSRIQHVYYTHQALLWQAQRGKTFTPPARNAARQPPDR